MSGTRRTDDLLSIKTRELVLQNPDGSFPMRGTILAVTDAIGTIAPVNDISLESVTVDTINVTGSLLQTNVLADEVQASVVNTGAMNVNYNMTATDISTNSVVANYITTADLSAGVIRAPNIHASAANVGTILNTHYILTSTANVAQISTPNFIGTSASIRDLSASEIRTRESTGLKNVIFDVSASRGRFTDISAGSAYATDISATSTRSTVFKATDLTVVDTITTNNLDVSGTLNITEINLDTLIVTRDLCANIVRTESIISRVARIDDLSAQIYDISGITVTGAYRAGSVQTNTLAATSLRPSTATVANLTVTGSAQMNSLTSPTLTVTTSISAGTMKTPVISASTLVSAQVIDLSGGILTYVAPSSLLVNGLATTDMSNLYQQPFSNVTKNGNLATVADVSSTLTSLTTSFNNLLGIFNQRGLVVSFLSQYTFNSPVSIQFWIDGVWKTPIVFPSGATDISGILSQLNSVSPKLQFSAKSSLGLGWRTTITATPSTSVAIGDISGSTQSLQMLRYLGFVIDDAANPFQTYAYSATSQRFESTLLNLSGSYVSTGSIPSFTNIANTLTAPTYAFIPSSATANSLSFRLNNPQGKYFYMNVSGVYMLFSAVNTLQTITGLAPNTTYQTSGYYLDSYNRSAVSSNVSGSTVALLPPTNLTASSTFNSVTLSWTPPFTGRTYSYRVDVLGSPSYNKTVPDTTATISKFPQNTLKLFKIYTVDTVYNVTSSPSNDISGTTAAFFVSPPSIITNTPLAQSSGILNNTTAIISFSARADVSSTLYYCISGSLQPTTTASITTLTGLTGSGDISGYIISTDNSYNTVTSAIITVRYDSSFGFYTFPVDGLKTYTLDGTSLSIGYLFASSPWIGYTFNRIIFPNNLTPTGSPGLIANVYNITPSVYYNLLKSGSGAPVSGSITPFDLTTKGTLIASSTPVLLTTSSPVTLSFSSTIIITSSTVVLLQISNRTTGQSVTVPAYNSVNQSLYATPLLYTNAGIYNDYITGTRGMICQFR